VSERYVGYCMEISLDECENSWIGVEWTLMGRLTPLVAAALVGQAE
jgi:hypothetical protein